ncbi:hypothetical protein VTJ04DRAFT_7834 [Mycothermus thermophilus]|uniref:uncharacterized protein n=1 Tax=Humicola insolens TaxID=85995 RepID=UPI00374460EE
MNREVACRDPSGSVRARMPDFQCFPLLPPTINEHAAPRNGPTSRYRPQGGVAANLNKMLNSHPVTLATHMTD